MGQTKMHPWTKVGQFGIPYISVSFHWSVICSANPINTFRFVIEKKAKSCTVQKMCRKDARPYFSRGA